MGAARANLYVAEHGGTVASAPMQGDKVDATLVLKHSTDTSRRQMGGIRDVVERRVLSDDES